MIGHYFSDHVLGPGLGPWTDKLVGESLGKAKQRPYRQECPPKLNF